MCWNEHVSLNTFMYSTFVLLLILYNNTYTQYKLPEFNTVWVYVFAMSIIFVQLLEYLVWRNLKNPFYNKLYSILICIVVISQPAFSVMLIPKESVRNSMVLLYSVLTIPYLVYKLMTVNMHCVKSKCGHLEWNMLAYNPYLWTNWFIFFLFGLVYSKQVAWALFAIGTLIVAFLNYLNDRSAESMWCWLSNSLMTFFAVKLLFWLPFVEKGFGC